MRRKAQEDFQLGLRCLVTEDGCELEGVGSREFLGLAFRGILMDGKKVWSEERFRDIKTPTWISNSGLKKTGGDIGVDEMQSAMP